MSDFPEKAEDKVNNLAVVVIGLATTLILWASVLALQAMFEETEGDMAAQRAAQGRDIGVRNLKANQKNEMHQNAWADASKGTLKRLDIDRAKAAVVGSAQANAPLIPTLGILNTPTVPAKAGKPVEGAPLNEATAEEGATDAAATDGATGLEGVTVEGSGGQPSPADETTAAPEASQP